MNNYGFLGIVQQGRSRPLAIERDTTDSLKLTTVGLQAAQTPESGEISLTVYEGSAIMVRGVDTGEWIYSAVIVDQAGPILTAVARQVFCPNEQLFRNKLKPIRKQDH